MTKRDWFGATFYWLGRACAWTSQVLIGDRLTRRLFRAAEQEKKNG